MTLFAAPPTTSLGRHVQETQRAARKQRTRGWRRIARGVAILIFAIFGVVGLSGGTAQAIDIPGLDNPANDVIGTVKHFCGPEDVPDPSSHAGFDSVLGLNVDKSDKRATVMPSNIEDVDDDEGNGIERLRKAYSDADTNLITSPTYERYGFSTLQWTNYGAGCFSGSYWISYITNAAFNIFVAFPMILGMGFLSFAMDNVFYDAFAVILSPFVAVFTAIFEPWIYFIAPLGVFLMWLKSKGSVQQTLKAVVWVLCIIGIFLWMGNSTSQVVRTATNFVTEFAGNAACKMSEARAGGQACDPNDPLGNIYQSLWYGVPYQTWLLGEVGPQGAAASKEAEANGELGWGPAILNGLYAGPDDDGDQVRSAVSHWNSLGYSPDDDPDTKVGYWTGDEGDYDDGEAAWKDIPFLAMIKTMCNDIATDGGGTDKAEKNQWMYDGRCDSSGAGTANIVPYFQGGKYAEQMVYAFAGGFSTLAVIFAVGLAAVYLMLQKMMFYFLLLFGPIFLAISTFADEKRRKFATRYGELMIANLIKQCVAVCVVLFVAYSLSALLYPPPGTAIPHIPWIAKPFAAVLFFIALLMFAIPMKNIAKAAAKGDTKVVDKAKDAPKDAAKKVGRTVKKTAKIGVGVGAIAATGGTALGGAAASGKGASLVQLGRAAGSRGGVGRGLVAVGRLANFRQQMADAKAQKQGMQKAKEAGVDALTNSAEGKKKYARDANGNLTPEARKAAEKDFTRLSSEGTKTDKAKEAQDAHMQSMFRGYKAETGKHLESDPEHPEKKRQAAVAKEQERLGIHNDAKSAQNRANGTTNGNDGGKEGKDPSYRAHYAADAKDNLTGPSFAKNQDVKPNVTMSGDDVLKALNISPAQAVADPSHLVKGDNAPYGGGDTTAMDPRHPATEPLTELRFALARAREDGEETKPGSATAQDVTQTAQRAQDAIAEHGVPSVVSGTHTTGETAAAFSSAQVVGAMPNLTDDVGWQERAAGAVTMQQASAMMPEGHPATGQVQSYVSALANPAVDTATVEGLKLQAIQAFDDTQESTPSSGTRRPDGIATPAPLSGDEYQAPVPTEHVTTPVEGPGASFTQDGPQQATTDTDTQPPAGPEHAATSWSGTPVPEPGAPSSGSETGAHYAESAAAPQFQPPRVESDASPGPDQPPYTQPAPGPDSTGSDPGYEPGASFTDHRSGPEYGPQPGRGPQHGGDYETPWTDQNSQMPPPGGQQPHTDPTGGQQTPPYDWPTSPQEPGASFTEDGNGPQPAPGEANSPGTSRSGGDNMTPDSGPREPIYEPEPAPQADTQRPSVDREELKSAIRDIEMEREYMRPADHRPDGGPMFGPDAPAPEPAPPAPAPDSDPGPMGDAPRGEGDDAVTEYNPNQKERRSGLYDYDDEEEDDG